MAVVRHAAARVLSLLPRAAPNFTLTKQPPELVAPNGPTPQQSLYLSNIDDQLGLRLQAPLLLFYRGDSSTKKNDEDPVKVIREALAKVLVHYYPFAGRLRETDNGKLRVDCTGEGILFQEADANVSLEDFGDLYPPIPRARDFIYDDPASETITDSPLLPIQVTRLTCGGFVLGLRLNHCIADGVGIAQFLKAVGEIARGVATLTVPPAWNREIFQPRANPVVKYPHHDYEYGHVEEDEYKALLMQPIEERNHTSFIFGSKEIDALKAQTEGERYTTFEVLSACLWQSRTRALNFPAHQEVKLLFALNARSQFQKSLPAGYYGNVITCACAKTKARDLIDQPLSFAVKLIKEAKIRVDEEYMRSAIDFLELKGRPRFHVGGTSYVISDTTRLDLGGADFGWGKAVYAAVMPRFINSFFTHLSRPSTKDSSGIVAPVPLPSFARESFEESLNRAVY